MRADVVVAGGGISGLLLASELARQLDVVLLEQRSELPTCKYWLTNENSVGQNSDLEGCVATRYTSLDFIAYDGTSATVKGAYALWDTRALVEALATRATDGGAQMLLGHAFHSYQLSRERVTVLAGGKTIRARLLVDCMGYESPIVSAKRTVRFLGFFSVQGRRFELRREIAPVGLHNALIQGRPSYFELFPDGSGHAYGAMIQTMRGLREPTTLQSDFRSVLDLEPYASSLAPASASMDKRVFGIVPVGVPRVMTLDRVFFFGEAAQANPPTSATGLTRMLYTYRRVAARLSACLSSGRVDKAALRSAVVPAMTWSHRRFQLALFRRVVNFTSDDFRKLVVEIRGYPDELINDLIFAEGPLTQHSRALLRALLRPNGLLGGSLLSGLFRNLVSYSRPSK